MVRTRTFNPETALSRAVDLFSSKGYSDTSMDDLVQATGVSRYGLYGTFGNKRELFEEALEKYAESMGRQGYLQLLEPDASIRHIQAIFDERIETMCAEGDDMGCMIAHTAVSLAPHDAEMKALLLKFMKRMAKAFEVGLESARSRGEVRPELDLKEASYFLTGAVFGMGFLARAGFPRSALEGFAKNTIDSLTD